MSLIPKDKSQSIGLDLVKHNQPLALLHYASIISLISLTFLCLAWETWLAPLRPNGSLLMLKALPLLVPLFGIMRKKIYTYQWAPMLILFYFAEGAVRAWSEGGLTRQLALAEIILSLVFFFSAIYFVRYSRRAKSDHQDP